MLLRLSFMLSGRLRLRGCWRGVINLGPFFYGSYRDERRWTYSQQSLLCYVITPTLTLHTCCLDFKSRLMPLIIAMILSKLTLL